MVLGPGSGLGNDALGQPSACAASRDADATPVPEWTGAPPETSAKGCASACEAAPYPATYGCGPAPGWPLPGTPLPEGFVWACAAMKRIAALQRPSGFLREPGRMLGVELLRTNGAGCCTGDWLSLRFLSARPPSSARWGHAHLLVGRPCPCNNTPHTPPPTHPCSPINPSCPRLPDSVLVKTDAASGLGSTGRESTRAGVSICAASCCARKIRCQPSSSDRTAIAAPPHRRASMLHDNTVDTEHAASGPRMAHQSRSPAQVGQRRVIQGPRGDPGRYEGRQEGP